MKQALNNRAIHLTILCKVFLCYQYFTCKVVGVLFLTRHHNLESEFSILDFEFSILVSEFRLQLSRLTRRKPDWRLDAYTAYEWVQLPGRRADDDTGTGRLIIVL